MRKGTPLEELIRYSFFDCLKRPDTPMEKKNGISNASFSLVLDEDDSVDALEGSMRRLEVSEPIIINFDTSDEEQSDHESEAESEAEKSDSEGELEESEKESEESEREEAQILDSKWKGSLNKNVYYLVALNDGEEEWILKRSMSNKLGDLALDLIEKFHQSFPEKPGGPKWIKPSKGKTRR
eukprot:TRINITY_DN10704_c0_g1_i1.p1 TRINITY_DN10704_c0_g1~~TRINITY_DN10704_c0_g1_i1.p1  ORF type:complete len:182 (+),score=64.29 TRINITY_DN10704_c0_g1_i1:411-956(+)